MGVSFLELRVDLFKKSGIEHARQQILNRRKLHIPIILTVRNQKKEGAVKESSLELKWQMLLALMPACDFIDIELSSPLCAKTVALARKINKKIIVSVHDFKRIPSHLNQILKKSLSARADIVKIAVNANSPEDLIRMVEFTHHNRKHSIATMCIGKWGVLSRMILPAAGSRLVYTFLNRPTAPGQMDIKTMQAALRFYYP